MIWLYNSRVIATFAVVFLHCTATVSAVTSDPIGSENWWIGNLYNSLVRWCVPVFVMISGSLLLDVNKQEDLRVFYAKRISRILIPTIFWSFFFIFWSFLKGIATGHEINIVNSVNMLLLGKPYYHMWFLYMIIPLYIFTPFFRKIVKDSSKTEMFYLIILLFIFSSANDIYHRVGPDESELFLYLFLQYIPYFLFGAVAGSNDEIFRPFWMLILFSASYLLTAFGCFLFGKTYGVDFGLYFYDDLSITVILMSISLFFLLKRLNKPICSDLVIKTMSSLTLGCYIVHPIFIDVAKYFFIDILLTNKAILIPSMSVVVFFMSLCFAFIISRSKYVNRIV